MILMARLTNLNSKVGLEVPLSYVNVWGVRYYVVRLTLSQSKQPTVSNSKNEKGPNSIVLPVTSELGITRSTKVPGLRRSNSTILVNRKWARYSTLDDSRFEGLEVKHQFKKLGEDVKKNNKANNLTTILSDKNFLVGCYQKIRSKPKTANLNLEILDDIYPVWFEKTCNSFRSGAFKFSSLTKKYILKQNGKLRPLLIPSLRDKIVQEGMKILLDAVFQSDFKRSSYAFQEGKGRHTALHDIRLHYSKVNWFVGGDVEQHYSSIDHSILMKILREKIEDEPFIDLVYKYLKVGYGEKKNDQAVPRKIGLVQGGFISPILFNISMHPFDVWIEEVLIPKYSLETKGKRNFGCLRYVRYLDNFLLGVQGSIKTCEAIRREIKIFLEENLALTLDVDKIKITHATTDHVVFLGHEISCIPFKKRRARCNKDDRSVKHVINTRINAPIQSVVKGLKDKGFLNKKNMPTRNGRYINIDLWNIVNNYKMIETRILSYYKMANNYSRLASKVHFSLKYSCALTISSKMKLKTMRGAFKKYGKDLTISVGDKIISYPKISHKRLRRKV